MRIGGGCEGGISIEAGDNGADVGTTGESGVPCVDFGGSVCQTGASVHRIRVGLGVACTGEMDANIGAGVGSCVAAKGIGVHDTGRSVFNSGALVGLDVGAGVRCTDGIGVGGTGVGVGGTGVGVGGTGVGVGGSGVCVGDTGVGDHVGACVGAVVVGAVVGLEDCFGTGDCSAGLAELTGPGGGGAVTNGAVLGEEVTSTGDGELTGFVKCQTTESKAK